MHYEREEFDEDMERVIIIVLQTSADNSTRSASKTFIATPATPADRSGEHLEVEEKL
ncbi:hypothetical protein INS49_003074 [Diaporthe citri]|uniref:uncharacterized protein n=1 Tax=Diaporthe citri TaxID=83186 RepID=UPI001C7FDDCF|nr:uncharacterized protein INS49_003074 [Diaporthe citri]KAG6368858.1 hypothetical protein INS49_003074 [Diaporthe citri]